MTSDAQDKNKQEDIMRPSLTDRLMSENENGLMMRASSAVDVRGFTPDYDTAPYNSQIFGESIDSRNTMDFENSVYHKFVPSTTPRRITFDRWVLTFAIAIMTAAIGAGVSLSVVLITERKFEEVHHLLDEGRVFEAYGMLLAWNMGLVAIAAVLCSYEPAAAGSGIPQVKAILNGMKMNRAVRISTLAFKVVGMISSVAGGMPVGKEGPMIHAGAIIGAGLSQGKSSYMGCDISFTKFSAFRNDKEKRDFISCGAACGIAGAFGAPIGGVLFSLEEGSSFWSQALTLRKFFCTTVSATTLALIMTTSNLLPTEAGNALTGMFQFGDFSKVNDGNKEVFRLLELPMFMVLGGLGGALGALFVWAHLKTAVWRARRIRDRFLLQVLECLTVSFVVSSVLFLTPWLVPICSAIPDPPVFPDTSLQLGCEAGFFNELGTLMINSPDVTIKTMFHDDFNFSIYTLVIYFLVYFPLVIWTSGTVVPGGLFVPMLLAGGILGRIFAIATHKMGLPMLKAGTYGLVGGGALLGGMSRVTISLTVMMIEATGNILFALPLMLSLIMSKSVGDLFGHGFYDSVITFKRWPFLEEEVPRLAKELKASEIMNVSFAKLENVCTVQDILNALDVAGTVQGTNAVAVYRTLPGDFQPKFCGYVLGYHLTCILYRHAFSPNDPRVLGPDGQPTSKEHGHPSSVLTWGDFEANYPRYYSYAKAKDRVDESELKCFVDLSPYRHKTPITVLVNAPVVQVYQIFRTMGLRHLWVLNHDGSAAGLITRKSLTHDWLEKRHREKMDHFGARAPD